MFSKHWYLISDIWLTLFQCFLSRHFVVASSSSDIEELSFDSFGNYETTKFLPRSTSYRLSFSLEDNHYVHIMTNSRCNISILLNTSRLYESSSQLRYDQESHVPIKIDKNNHKYAILHPVNTYEMNLCANDANAISDRPRCTFILYISQNYANSGRSIPIKVNKGKILQPGKRIQDSLPKYKRRRYGFFLDTIEIQDEESRASMIPYTNSNKILLDC